MRISVVIPAYNAEPFMRRCLQSVFAQTLKPHEVIVMDDGSTDKTAALAAELGARVLSGPNRGPSFARNEAMRAASGEWIALLDADDLWAPNKLECQTAIIRPETLLVYTGVQTFDDAGLRDTVFAIDPARVKKMLRYCNPIVPSATLIRRDDVLRIGGFREGLAACEDWEMWMRLKNMGCFDAVREPLTSYYIHSASLSANPETMLAGLSKIMNSALLADLQGIKRRIWRQRSLATQLASAGLIARENGLTTELSYMFQSLLAWPFPSWEPRRLVMFAISARNRLRQRNYVW